VLPSAGSRLLLGLAATLATVLYAIDSTIVNVALPNIQGTLQASPDQAGWVVTSYIVVSAIMTPLAGWLGVRFGIQRVLGLSILGFTAGSMLCGVAATLTQMVLFRMIQGAFGAALVPLSQVALLSEFPRESHARVMALWGMGVMVGPVIGPTLGGWLTDQVSWRWAFYINLPLGIVAWLALVASLRAGGGNAKRPFDLVGFVLLSIAVGCLQMMLDRGETQDWFASTEIVAEAFCGAIAFYMFVVHSVTGRQPFVDIHLFNDRNFTVSMVMMFVIGVAVISPSVLVPGFLEQVKGYTPTQAGWLMAARGAASVVAMLLGARLSSTIGPRPTMTIGILLATVSLLMMGQFSVDTQTDRFLWASVLQGLGTPLTFMPLSLIAYATLADKARTEAGVLLTLIRNIGASVGISVVISLLARSAQHNAAHLVEHFTAYDLPRWQALGGGPGANTATVGVLGEIRRQATGIAYANDFLRLAVATVVTLPLVWLLRNPRQHRPVAAPSAPAAEH
jgi:MFS transporter, DHA2 family, multidrug resistance protein